jgi:hypothetical protein
MADAHRRKFGASGASGIVNLIENVERRSETHSEKAGPPRVAFAFYVVTRKCSL